MSAVPPVTARSDSLHHKAASYAIVALAGAFALQCFLVAVSRILSAELAGVLRDVPMVVLISAIPAGVVALCGIPKYGLKKLLWKGLAGMIVPIVLFVLTVQFVHFLRATERERLQEAGHSK